MSSISTSISQSDRAVAAQVNTKPSSIYKGIVIQNEWCLIRSTVKWYIYVDK